MAFTDSWPPSCDATFRLLQLKLEWAQGQVFKLFDEMRVAGLPYRGLMQTPVMDRVDLGYYSDSIDLLIVGSGATVPNPAKLPADRVEMTIDRCSEDELREVDRLFPGAGLFDWVAARLRSSAPRPSEIAVSPVSIDDEERLVEMLRTAPPGDYRERVRQSRIPLFGVLRQELEKCGIQIRRFDPTGSTVGDSIHSKPFGLNSDLDVYLVAAPPFVPAGFYGNMRMLEVILGIVRSRFVELHGVIPNFLLREK